jgi:serine/threonine-protein kinase RsbW
VTVASVTVPHVPASAGQVRRELSADLVGRNVRAAAVDEAALLVTELVGNSVRHARPLADGCILVSWRIDSGGRLHVRVTDGGSPRNEPHVSHAGPQDTRGRGLTIVDALASLWGVERGTGSTTVWAVLPIREVRREYDRHYPASSGNGLGERGHRLLSGT